MNDSRNLRRASVVAKCLIVAFVCLIGGASTRAAFAQGTPAEELSKMQPGEDLDVTMFASEPMITNPSAIDVDTHGRVWVAEIQWYRRAAKQPPADKIKVLEDTDGDGVADKVTVFAEGLFCPMSICVAGDKVYVATSPDLWVFEDKDGDLKADGPPKKVLTGFGGFNHDHGAHSMVLGPDHKWWMSVGDEGFDIKGNDDSHIAFQWGAMLRGELDGTKLETVAVNFRNPYEICVSSFGEAYCSDNDDDGNRSVRICWIMEGGNYGWFGNRPAHAPPGVPFGEHWHFRGFIPGFVPAMMVTGFGSPCGITYYESDALGPKFKDAPLHVDAGPGEARIYRTQLSGFGMKADNEVFLKSNDRYFRPDDICTAPDGVFFVSDWYDGGVGGHAYNNPDQGRIFRLTPKGKKLARVEKPGPYATLADAAVGLKSPNLATQYLARERLLAENGKSVATLTELLSDPQPDVRARALWVLDRIGGDARGAVLKQLKSDNAAFRALAVRILRRHGAEYADAILPLADDQSSEVVREVLLAIRKIDSDRARETLAKIAAQYDGQDRYLLEAIHVAAGEHKQDLYDRLAKKNGFTLDQFALLELLNPSAAAERLTKELNSKTADPATLKKLMVAAGVCRDPIIGESLLAFVANDASPAELRKFAMTRLTANMNADWRSLTEGGQLPVAFRKLLANPASRDEILSMIGAYGIGALAPDVLALATSKDSPEGVRLAAIQTLSRLNMPQVTEGLKPLLADSSEPVRETALLALIDGQNVELARKALVGDGLTFSAPFLQKVVDRMLGTTEGALVLRKLIQDKKLSKSQRNRAISKATKHPDANVRVLYEEFIPADQRPKRLGESISAKEILELQGDVLRGDKVFMKSKAAQCRSCHTIGDTGGVVGPNLSSIGRKYERAALLETILDPSKAIAPEYVPYTLTTKDGRMFVGFLAEKSEKEVVIRDAKNELHRIKADDVDELTAQTKSVMPELILKDITAQDAADLLAYLMSQKQ